MSHHHETKPLWLVQPRLDAETYRDTLIGSCVKYADLPIERRIPYNADKLAKDMVPDIDPKPVQIRNVRFWTRRIKDAKVSASVNEILEAFGERAREEESENIATVARVWHMDSPGLKFKELCKNKQYFEELFDLLQSNHNTAYFVTDIVTLTNLEVTDSKGKTNGLGAGAKVPIDPSLGVDIHAQGSFSVVKEKGYSACYEEESIVFLGYRLVKLEKVTGTRARLGRIFLGQKHGFTVRDGFDYWPEIVDRPVEGNAEPFLRVMTPKTEEPKQLEEAEAEAEGIVHQLGYDIEIVG